MWRALGRSAQGRVSAAVLALIVAGIAAVQAAQDYRAELLRESKQLSSLARIVGDAIDARMAAVDMAVRDVAADFGSGDIQQRTLDRNRAALSSLQDVASQAVYGMDGLMIASDGYGFPPSVVGESFFSAQTSAAAGAVPFVGALDHDPNRGLASMVYARQIHGDPGVPNVIITVEFQISLFDGILRAAHEASGATLRITRYDGTVVGGDDMASHAGAPCAAPVRDPAPCLSAERPLAASGLVVTAEMPIDRALAGWRKSAILALFSAIGFGVIAFVLGALYDKAMAQSQSDEAELRRHVRELGRIEREQALRAAELAASTAALARERAAAQTANLAKSHFIDNMSHELRTPLNAIIGFADMIRRGLLGNDADEKSRRYGGYIHYSGRRLLDLVNAILTLARLEQGGGALAANTTDIDVYALLRAAAAAKSALINERSITPKLDVARKVQHIQTDETALRATLTHLLGELIRSADHGTFVEITVRATGRRGVSFLLEAKGGAPGAAMMAHLFQPFQQADAAVNHQREGTGLEMTLSAAMIGALGGTLTAESTPREGMKFRLSLPHAGLGGSHAD